MHAGADGQTFTAVELVEVRSCGASWGANINHMFCCTEAARPPPAHFCSCHSPADELSQTMPCLCRYRLNSTFPRSQPGP